MKNTLGAYAVSYRVYRRKRRRRIVFAVLLLGLAALMFAMSAVFGMDAGHKLDVSKIIDVPQSLILYDRDGREITTLHAAEDRIWVPLSTVPKHTRDAFIAAEDARFYDHFGVDVVRILGAAWADIKAGAYVQGASTSPELSSSHLSADKKMERKRRSGAGLHWSSAMQGRDIGDVPQLRLFRRRLLWCGGRGARLFRRAADALTPPERAASRAF